MLAGSTPCKFIDESRRRKEMLACGCEFGDRFRATLAPLQMESVWFTAGRVADPVPPHLRFEPDRLRSAVSGNILKRNAGPEDEKKMRPGPKPGRIVLLHFERWNHQIQAHICTNNWLLRLRGRCSVHVDPVAVSIAGSSTCCTDAIAVCLLAVKPKTTGGGVGDCNHRTISWLCRQVCPCA